MLNIACVSRSPQGEQKICEICEICVTKKENNSVRNKEKGDCYEYFEFNCEHRARSHFAPQHLRLVCGWPQIQAGGGEPQGRREAEGTQPQHRLCREVQPPDWRPLGDRARLFANRTKTFDPCHSANQQLSS